MNGVRMVQLPEGTEGVRASPIGHDGEQDPAQLGKEELVRRLQLAGQRIESLTRSERLQQSLYEIADLAGGSRDMQDMLRRIHAIVGDLMYAENFYIVQYDEFRQKIRFLYFVDKLDPFINDPDADLDFDQADANLTMALLQGGQAMRGPSWELQEQSGISPLASNGPDSADWLGVPMLREDRVVGGIVVQSYERPSVYSDEDRALLAYVAQHILTALDRHHARGELEQRV